ncbi:MAG: methylaspartate ammonia-lyase, partial [Gaiellales bacterium]
LAGELAGARELLLGAGEIGFRSGSDRIDAHRIDGRQLHTALRYGLSQALLAAEAADDGVTPLRVLTRETGLEEPRLVPVYAQSGDDRRLNADRMILRRVDVLPHGLFNSTEAFGADGGVFLDYVRWLVERIRAVGGGDYRPRLHLDVYGMLGLVTGQDVAAMAAFLAEVEAAADGLEVAIEAPCLGDDTDSTIDLLARLRTRLAEQGTRVRLVADEFCNGDEDVARFVEAGAVDLIQIKMPDLGCLTEALKAAAACRAGGLGVFIGGSCAETDLSAQLSAQVAMAVDADQVLAKPGMGVDEGIAIVRNAMRRALVEWEHGR